MNKPDIYYTSKSGFTFHHILTDIYEIKEKTQNISHSHPQFEVYYLVSGDVYYHVSGKTYHANKGDVLLLNAFESHFVEVLPTEDYERYVVEFTLDNIPTLNGITPLYDFFHSHPQVLILSKNIVDTTNILSTLQKMENECQNVNKYTNHFLLADIITLVTNITMKLEEAEGLQELEISTINSNSVYINNITQYINANVSKKITIDDVAKAVHLSKSYLQHLFKDVIGVPLATYIFRQKMHSANFMLQNGKSLNDTAVALGYTYYSTFSAHYKKFFGKCPKTQTR